MKTPLNEPATGARTFQSAATPAHPAGLGAVLKPSYCLVLQRAGKSVLLVLLGLALCGSARAGLYHFTGPNTGDAGAGVGVIAAGNSIPLVNIESVSGIEPTIADVVLNVSLGTSDGASDIQGLLRLGDTSSSHYVTFNPTGSSFSLDFSAFNNLSPNDNWTLSFANPSGAFDNNLLSWSLDITAVPERENVAMAIFGGIFVAVSGWKAARRSKLSRACASAG